MANGDADIPLSIREACEALASHGAVVSVCKAPEPIANGDIRVVFQVEVPLPSRIAQNGISRTGVLSIEDVTFDFPEEFPLKAPKVRLRKDFPLNFPHIYPYRAGNYVHPCIYEGELDELLQQPNGFNLIVNQVVDWLVKASRDDLIDSTQGWEPIRRDNSGRVVVFDLDDYHPRVSKGSGVSDFVTFFIEDGELFWGKVSQHLSKPANVNKLIEIYNNKPTEVGLQRGNCLGVFAWPAEQNIANKYHPDSVNCLKELKAFTQELGASALLYRLNVLAKNLSKINPNATLKLLVLLCARRPQKIINGPSNLEIIPYIAELKLQTNGILEMWDDNSPVFPVIHKHESSSSLLRTMSGSKKSESTGNIIQLGCGSLGSKIATHLARAGHGPFELYDRSYFSPHNYARHALFEIPENIFRSKVEALSYALFTLKQKATQNNVDIVRFVHGRMNKKSVFPGKPSIVIDATASLSVREALSMIPVNKLQEKLVNVGLYSSGNVGTMAFEGARRSPRIDDLAVKLLDLCIDDERLRNKLKPSDDPFTMQGIGQGCGSHTMVMPDTTVSMYAASMTENIRKALESSDDMSGLWVGINDGLSINWEYHGLGQTRLAVPVDGDKWEIRILSSAAEQMEEDSLRYVEKETGGVLFGKVFPARKTVIITRTLPPPEDSEWSENEFILGTKGLRETVVKTQKLTGNTLCYVGTWHSHPRGGAPSGKDRSTLKRMVEQRLGFPTINLIWTPTEYLAIMDEGISFRE